MVVSEQITLGAMASITVTVALQVAELPLTSTNSKNNSVTWHQNSQSRKYSNTCINAASIVAAIV